MRDEEFDFLVGHYVLGLTSVLYRNRDPQIHLAVYRSLLKGALSAPRAEKVLHEVLPNMAASVEQAFDVVEKLGRQDGALLDRPRASGN